MKSTCPICEKGTLQPKKVTYEVYGIKLGLFPAKVCSVCKEEWFNEETSRRIEAIEKKKGLFGLSKKTKISYSGNSLVIRIPEALVSFMGIKKEDEVLIHPEGKSKIAVELA
ncbi:hypothetical protein HYX14_04830 [Candidatus Woesearchaeota archaeon]|nr:hypothetical protein [Candidatus Woesearchaeota archaeon]